MQKETIILSLGGSLVAPADVDVGFLKTFRFCIQKYLGKYNFYIYVGGGKICRVYQNALLEFGGNAKQRDLMGINISRLNAEVVKQVFDKSVLDKVVIDPTKKIKTTKPIIVGAGYKPGWSTDYVSVLSAKTNGIKTIINLSNIDYVYDKNPTNFPDAKPLKEIDWKSFERIVGSKWSPGLSMPFDPRASKLAERLKLKVVVINGKYLDRLEDFLNNKDFVGTTIK
jgi:uridylate kinase